MQDAMQAYIAMAYAIAEACFYAGHIEQNLWAPLPPEWTCEVGN